MMFLSSISTPSIEGFSHPRTSIFPSISQGSWIFPSKTWIFPSKTSISQGSVTVISRSRFQDCCDLWWLSPGGPGGEMAKGRRMVEFHQKPAEIVILTYNVYVYIYIYLPENLVIFSKGEVIQWWLQHLKLRFIHQNCGRTCSETKGTLAWFILV